MLADGREPHDARQRVFRVAPADLDLDADRAELTPRVGLERGRRDGEQIEVARGATHAVRGERRGADHGERDPAAPENLGHAGEQAQPISSCRQRDGRRPIWR